MFWFWMLCRLYLSFCACVLVLRYVLLLLCTTRHQTVNRTQSPLYLYSINQTVLTKPHTAHGPRRSVLKSQKWLHSATATFRVQGLGDHTRTRAHAWQYHITNS